MPTAPKISVVIPCYNAAPTLAECLASVLAAQYAPFEVIVVDDGSRDNSAEIAGRFDCRVLRLPHNVGAARAKNAGAGAAGGDILFFTDADCLIRPDALRLIAGALAGADVTGVVGLLDTRLRYSDFPSQFKNLWMHFTYLRLPRQVGVFYTSAAAARRAAFAAVGGFDPHYAGASIAEDMDLGQRFLSAGHVIVSEKRLLVEHLKHYGWRELLQTDLDRAAALTKVLLRRKLGGGAGPQRHYASVPWYFALAVPLSWLAALALLLAIVWAPALALAALCAVAIEALNWPFLSFLRRQRGWAFFVQSSLFLLPDMFVSGLGILYGLVQFARGKRY